MNDLLKKNYFTLRNPKCRALDALKEAKRDAERGRITTNGRNRYTGTRKRRSVFAIYLRNNAFQRDR